MTRMIRSWLGSLGMGALMSACQTADWSDEAGGRVYLKGRGIAKYHNYDAVSKCRTAFGLDPRAFDMRVTAASSEITKRIPAMRKNAYESEARCIRVQREGSRQSIVVRAIDVCCGGDLRNPRSHQLDLSRQAFEKLGPRSRGNLFVNWAVVDCPPSLEVPDDAAVCRKR